MKNLEDYFAKFRKNIIGVDQKFNSNSKEINILYADWIASGRLYRPIEMFISETLGPYVANTHTETTITGTTMTDAYHQAQKIIKRHVNANENDVIINSGFGMTSVINKFQRLLGLRIPEKARDLMENKPKPLVIITHLEHHSNQTSWYECHCDVEIIKPDATGLPDLEDLQNILEKNKDRKLIIGSISACSNVTGIIVPIHDLAKLIHQYNGYCFADYAASAPYVDINMHPNKKGAHLDAVFFSPHKFLGGPGSSGVLIFNKNLYQNSVPDHPGGGTVKWTNPWGQHRYFENIEAREDGGTPGFLQAIKTSLAILLKEEMGTQNILDREHEIIATVANRLKENPRIHVLESHNLNRLSVFSFYIENIHYNLFVKLLNDIFGIQTRGGCSCAGTYGHILLHVDKETSKRITSEIDEGDLTHKPGWVRLSLHPTMTNDEIDYICDSILDLAKNIDHYSKEYEYNQSTGEFSHKIFKTKLINLEDSFYAN